MLEQAVVIFCICDEITKALKIKDDFQCKMSTSEVMIFALSSALINDPDWYLSRV